MSFVMIISPQRPHFRGKFKQMILNIEGIQVTRSLHYPGFLEFMESASEADDLEENERALIRNNIAIMKRLEDRMSLIPELNELLQQEEIAPRIWVVIMEAQCPDGARNLPFIRTIAEATPNIELLIVLRDESPELMDRFLTDGKRAVPKLLETVPGKGKVFNTWGPRPAPLQEQVIKWKEEEPDIPKEELQRRIQKWYAKDRGKTLQEELSALLKKESPLTT